MSEYLIRSSIERLEDTTKDCFREQNQLLQTMIYNQQEIIKNQQEQIKNQQEEIRNQKVMITYLKTM